MHVYHEGPTFETLTRSLGELKRAGEQDHDLAEHVEVLVDVVKRSMPALPKVVWEGDSSRGRYRVVGKIIPGSADGPRSFVVERGTLNALGEWSWNGCGNTTPGPVFQQILRDYCRLLDAAPEVAL